MHGRPRLLLVEDSEDTRILLAVALAGDGWTVDEAADAFQGAALLGRNRYDLVLADYDLPGKTGAAMVREAAEAGRLHDAKVVMVTAHPDPQGIEELEVIRKPLDLPAFLHQMRKIRDAAVAARGADVGSVVDLVLYVSAHSLASARALDILKTAILHASPGVRLTVCDLATDPEAADADNVVFTPTLVKRQPLPRTWILGDLTRPETVKDLLQSFRPPA
jgi:two-component system response regulator GlrR